MWKLCAVVPRQGQWSFQEQITACKKHASTAHWAYNRGVQRKQDEYRKTGKRPSAMDLHRELNAAKILEKLAASSADSQNACGEGSAGKGSVAPVQLPSVKREPNT